MERVKKASAAKLDPAPPLTVTQRGTAAVRVAVRVARRTLLGTTVCIYTHQSCP